MLTEHIKKRLSTVSASACKEEQACVAFLVGEAAWLDQYHAVVAEKASMWVRDARAHMLQPDAPMGIEAFFSHYGLQSKEGQAIVMLAEALPRIPDAGTAHALLHDKLEGTVWGTSPSVPGKGIIKASARGLQVVTALFRLGGMVSRLADPVVREAARHAIHLVAGYYVAGETMDQAVTHMAGYHQQGYMFSYDMLGEAARTEAQALAFYHAYAEAVATLANQVNPQQPLLLRPAVSVKLSALYPRFTLAKQEKVFTSMYPRLKALVELAMQAGIGITIDAEEASRADITLAVFAALFQEKTLSGYEGLGIAVQAYQKRAWETLLFLIEMGSAYKKRIPVRLVKGAYWDSEIKEAQQAGLEHYPVFTHKAHTDISYLACARKMLGHPLAIYPQFASHNAYTIAAIQEMAGNRELEFQRLYGMGEGIYRQIVGKVPCRIYVPVGHYQELLPYLIRRLLENGANNAFVRAMADNNVPVEALVRNPVEAIHARDGVRSRSTINSAPAPSAPAVQKRAGAGLNLLLHPLCAPASIPLPADIVGPARKNSKGMDAGNWQQQEQVGKALALYTTASWQAGPVIGGQVLPAQEVFPVYCPYALHQKMGDVGKAGEKEIEEALVRTSRAVEGWQGYPVEKRAAILETYADIVQENQYELMALCIREGGKTVMNALAEIREAIDFCRYYAAEARRVLGTPLALPGPTGESNVLTWHGRGVFACISPWNFPLAIFTGQIAAALVSGNTVVAKPARQASLLAHRAVMLLLEAGLPPDAIALLPGEGKVIGEMLCKDARLAGVAMTGSTHTAMQIQQMLALRKGPLIPLIAETGGQNAMIVDSSALLERVVEDTIISAFDSAGQRCSALRVVFVQEEIADAFCGLLAGAMQELELGDPGQWPTDIGPVIDKVQQEQILSHNEMMQRQAKFIASSPLPAPWAKQGFFVAPSAFEIPSLGILKEEIFGPVLHVIRFNIKTLDKVVEDINATGYGLTLGIHSRIQKRIDFIRQKAKVGNIYVNRTMIGATVGVQPFGGEGLSGTGPKAGGPHYLLRFCTERTFTVNTTAFGGNIALL